MKFTGEKYSEANKVADIIKFCDEANNKELEQIADEIKSFICRCTRKNQRRKNFQKIKSGYIVFHDPGYEIVDRVF